MDLGDAQLQRRRARVTRHDPQPRTERPLSETEIRERIRKLRADLELFRLPSPERLQLLEALVLAQDQLVARLTVRP
ncbi:MAG TPA: hypothetical protein VGI28_01710 [Stellaceae bacterium]|jgi:hypothetical protein